MDQKYIFIEHINSINNDLMKKFQSIKRIKLTCFDVSNNYIIFGASSGGIYIFNREPCQFLKLIPSKEGSAVKILVSPNEKNVALASSKGLIIIIEDFSTGSDLKYQVYTEHEGHVVTDMIWENNELYCGDNTGKITVTTVSNLFTKAIFQSPTVSLMQLDSNIVQLDVFSKYLLISTRTRSYLCDTEKEQYKQIGKKLRDGNFGACFFNVIKNCNSEECKNQVRGVFKTAQDDESFCGSDNNSNVKIYCSRPGIRLWEANFEAAVVLTHQFRNSLGVNPSDILLVKEELDAHLDIETFDDSKETSISNFNFGTLHSFCEKFILTYSTEGIYIFEPSTGSLVFWINKFRDIIAVKILNSLIYVWQKNLQINVVGVESLENLIMKTLFNKQYYFCSEICVKFSDDVVKLIDNSNKIHLLLVLQEKVEDEELKNKIEPILCKIKESSSDKIVVRKFSNGIVAVDNSHIANKHLTENTTSEIFPAFKDITSNVTTKFNEGTKTLKEKFDFIETTVRSLTTNLPSDSGCRTDDIVEKDDPYKILQKQFNLNKSHENVETTETTKLFEEMNLDSILNLLTEFLNINLIDNGDNIKTWCQEQFLKQAIKKDFDILQLSKTTQQYLLDCVLDINRNNNYSCTCDFPLPKTNKRRPKYHTICYKLFENCDDYQTLLLKNIPYLYKVKLNSLQTSNDLQSYLSLIVQFNSKEVYKQYSNTFTYDMWDDILKYMVKLKAGKCLNCGENIDLDEILTWTDIGVLMVHSINPQNTTKLLKRYSSSIPNSELTAVFFQTCIFKTTFSTSQSEDQPHIENFGAKIIESQKSAEFDKLMEKFLLNKYLWKSSIQTIKEDQHSDEKCNYCSISLCNKILNESTKLACGHVFHKLCISYVNNICNICTRKM